MLKVNLGSGPVGGSQFEKEEWLNIDKDCKASEECWHGPAKYAVFDVRDKGNWPIETCIADCIYASHIIEHIEYQHLLHVVNQCYRILKPQHPMRVICPDPRIFVANWQAKNKQHILDSYGEENYKRWNYDSCPNIAFTDMFFGDHYAHALIPSIDMIAVCMIRVGFSKVTEMNYGNTEFPEYFGGTDNRPSMSWYLEGVK